MTRRLLLSAAFGIAYLSIGYLSAGDLIDHSPDGSKYHDPYGNPFKTKKPTFVIPKTK